jgi:hypothetical protein
MNFSSFCFDFFFEDLKLRPAAAPAHAEDAGGRHLAVVWVEGGMFLAAVAL